MIRAQNELSRTLVYMTSMTCGVLAAIAAEILLRRTGVEIDYRYKLESIDLWETVVITNNKSALPVLSRGPVTIAA